MMHVTSTVAGCRSAHAPRQAKNKQNDRMKRSEIFTALTIEFRFRIAIDTHKWVVGKVLRIHFCRWSWR